MNREVSDIRTGATASWMLALMLLLAVRTAPAEPVTIGIVGDGEPIGQIAAIEGLFVAEIDALTRGEFEVRYERFYGDWTGDSIRGAYAEAATDPDVDIVLALGIAANQMLVSRRDFAKPTFLPLVFDGQLLNAPRDGNSSGLENLSYITDRMDFDEHLRALRRVVPFDRVAFLLERIYIDVAPVLGEQARQVAARDGIDVVLALHPGDDSDPLALIDPDIDAVIVAGLPRMAPEAFDAMLEAFVDRQIPAFGLTGGRSSVERGLLASDAVGSDMTRLARRNALNMQAVLLGEAASAQSVIFEGKRELTINMEVARRIGVSPRFDVLSEAVLLNEEPAPTGAMLTLKSVAETAIEQNLDLLAERYGVDAGRRDVAIAGANLLPQIGLSSSYQQRRVTPLVESGTFAERSTDAALQLSQPVYVDDLWANRTIQQQVQLSREQFYRQVELDIIQSATISFLNVLRAETQLRILQDNLNLTRTNLELARDRVRVGSSSSADIFRWEARLANVRASVLSGRSTVDQAREALNRILDQPIDERFQLDAPTVDAPFVFSEADFNKLVDNPRRWRLFMDYSVEGGLAESPELAQFDALIRAKAREVTNLRRDFWLPDVTLSGQYSDNLDQSGVGSGPPFEGIEDWSVALQASLPLYAGGGRRAAVSRADLELQQLQAQRAATADRVEQSIRAAMHDAYAAYNNIRLSDEAAVASSQNLALVTDAYSQGVVSIIDLLDAQNASLQADEAAANAVFDFLINVMNAERASGQFGFLLPQAQQDGIAQALRNFIATSEATE
ncbi:MAG: TolC family protein [Pseudomonadota bacterium]